MIRFKHIFPYAAHTDLLVVFGKPNFWINDQSSTNRCAAYSVNFAMQEKIKVINGNEIINYPSQYTLFIIFRLTVVSFLFVCAWMCMMLKTFNVFIIIHFLTSISNKLKWICFHSLLVMILFINIVFFIHLFLIVFECFYRFKRVRSINADFNFK